MNITYTKEQMEKLEHLEKIFNQACYHAYKHSTTFADNQMVNEIYNETVGVNDKRNLNCGACVLRLYQQAGEIYFRTKDMFSAELEPETITDSISTNNKRGRKKKVAENE